MGTLAPFFEWLTASATYEGKRTYHEIDYDLWGYTVSEGLVSGIFSPYDQSLSLSLSLSLNS